VSPLLHWLIVIVGSTVGGLIGGILFRHRGSSDWRAGRMAIGPDDKIVIRLNHAPHGDCVERIAKLAKEVFPDNKVLVLGPDIDLKVAAPQTDSPGRTEVSN
jgi:hypothetical protein